MVKRGILCFKHGDLGERKVRTVITREELEEFIDGMIGGEKT
jgi:hypothetical protein